MINKIFPKVTRPVEQQVVKASTYIEEKVAPKIAEAPKKSIETLYSSPFAPIGEGVKPDNAGEILFTFG